MTIKPSVLVVEDDSGWQEMFMDVLERSGEQKYHIEMAKSAEQAISLLKRETFDLAILDLRLNHNDPHNEDGVVLLKYIRTNDLPTSVIIASAYLDAKKMNEILQNGFENVEFLLKDSRFERYVQAVERGIQNAHKVKSGNISQSKPLDGILEIDSQQEQEIKDTNTSPDRSAKIFISYARDDVDTVEEIRNILLDANHDPWMDIHSIIGGEEWLSAIYRAIKESDIFLAVLSNNSVSKRGTIQKELKKALAKWEGMLPDDIYIIPIRIDDCPYPTLLENFQVLDWDDGIGKNKLLEAIQGGLARRMDT